MTGIELAYQRKRKAEDTEGVHRELALGPKERSDLKLSTYMTQGTQAVLVNGKA